MESTTSDIKAAMIGWERLRLVYNGVLLIVGLWSSWDLRADFGSVSSYAFFAAAYAIAANAFYSLGPLAEIYYCCLVGPMARFRIVVFVAGLLLSIAITVGLAFIARMSIRGAEVFGEVLGEGSRAL
jgi:hypothetical protein